MDREPLPPSDRILHARVEVLLRAAIHDAFGRLVGEQQTPLVVVAHDRSRATRWLAGGDAGLLAAVAAELDPVAAGCLLLERARPEHLVGTAVTVSRAGSRAVALDAHRRRVGHPRVVFGRQEAPQGVAAEVAGALLATVERAARLRSAA